MKFDWELVLVAIFIATIIERLVEWFVTPLLDWLNELIAIPKNVKLYVAGIAGFAAIFISNINLFATIPQVDYQIGLILSGLLVGGGSTLLHDTFSSIRRSNR